MRLKDKVVLITSAQNPCAEAIAAGFAREGANCAIFDGDAGKAEQLGQEVRALGRKALALQVDITKKSEIEAAVRRTIAEFGCIDVLLNCSGISHESDFLGLTEEAFNQCIDRGPGFPGSRPPDARAAFRQDHQFFVHCCADRLRRIRRQQRSLLQH